MTNADDKTPWKALTEQLEIAGHRLLETVTGLAAEGNVRRLRIRTGTGEVFMEIPLTAGAIAGGAVVLTAPWLAAIGAIAGVAAKAHIEIVREGDGPAKDA
ncbi:MAG: DUF4342 domain-containing protein [Devosia sp.]